MYCFALELYFWCPLDRVLQRTIMICPIIHWPYITVTFVETKYFNGMSSAPTPVKCWTFSVQVLFNGMSFQKSSTKEVWFRMNSKRESWISSIGTRKHRKNLNVVVHAKSLIYWMRAKKVIYSYISCKSFF